MILLFYFLNLTKKLWTKFEITFEKLALKYYHEIIDDLSVLRDLPLETS